MFNVNLQIQKCYYIRSIYKFIINIMRTFLSKFLLLMFVAVFSVPASLFAQTENNWTPPTGGPVIGTNVPSPINIGIQPQTKQGPIRLKQGFVTNDSGFLNDQYLTDGATIFDSNGSSNNYFASFVPSYFTNTLSVGSSSNPSELGIFGRLRFKPTSGSAQPQAGSVLKSADTDGNVTWGAAIPDGENNGETLIWNETCQCWVTGPVTVNPGGANLPPGQAGNTMWYNGATNQWEATSMLNHVSAAPNVMRTNLINPAVLISGPSIMIGNNNLTGVVPDAIFGTRVMSSLIRLGTAQNNGDIHLNGLNVNVNTANNNTLYGNRFTVSGGFTDISSPFVTFKDPAGGTQTALFNSSFVKFKGPTSNPSLLDAGAGRIPMSVDDDGTFKWNRYLTYTQTQPIPGFDLGQLTLSNNESGYSAFVNEGLSMLQGDTYVGTGGDLYLEGLDGAYYSQWVNGSVKHLCYIEGSFKVVMCPPSGSPGDAPTNGGEVGPVASQGDGTVTFTDVDNGSQFTFNFTGTVDVKYCGGGGGGGGGGIGAPANNQPENAGTGGSGGGGGAAGQCFTEEIDVTSGDVLTWNIGSGGDRGQKAQYTTNSSGYSSTSGATNGGYGDSTSITFDPVSGPSYQVGQVAQGGMYGSKGGSMFETSPGDTQAPRGLSGNFSFQGINNGNNDWNGQFGYTTNNGTSVNCNSCGGRGGIGEAYDVDGNVLTGLSGTTPSAGGGGGIGAPTPSSVYFGQKGRCGAPGHGGGGGGGAYGDVWVTYNPGSIFGEGYSFWRTEGGDGGCGGTGYVTISGLPENVNPGSGVTEIVFDTPGSHNLSPDQLATINAVIAANIDGDPLNFTVELWGAGGGAGSVPTNPSVVTRTQGGGSGEYIKMTVAPSQITSSTFIVGAKGANGSRGGTTYLSQFQSDYQLAKGGWGLDNSEANGKGGGWNQNPGWPSHGYTGHTAGPNYNRGQEGLAGSTGGSACNLSGEAIPTTLGFGNGEPRKCIDPTLNVYQGTAQNGRIRISW